MSYDNTRQQIGRRIKIAREQKGHSQQSLADLFSISRAAVTQWESGGTVPELERFVDLANVLGVSTDYLLKGIETNAVADEHASYNLSEHEDPTVLAVMRLPAPTRALFAQLAEQFSQHQSSDTPAASTDLARITTPKNKRKTRVKKHQVNQK